MSRPTPHGVLFADPHPDRARQAFAEKPRSLVDKRCTVRDAVARFAADGQYWAFGGFGANRIPTAVIHELLRRNPQGLSFSGHTATHTFQLMCAGNLTNRGALLKRVDIAYVVGLEARGLSAHARRVLESGSVEICEWTNYAMAARLQAAAIGVPYIPIRTMLGTDTIAHSAAKIAECPFTGVPLALVPALYPDVAAIHVHEADIYGNCRIRGVTVADLDLARAAKKLIVTCERLIPHDEIRRDPDRTAVPFFCVDAVCEVPFGSYPGNMAGEYYSDEEHFRRWLDVERDPDAYRAFLDHHVFGCTDFEQYVERSGGMRRMRELRDRELLLS